ncbi:hypothetical protein [Streptomyces sp. NPDC001927]
MRDRIKLWLRKAGAPLLVGVLAFCFGVAEERSLPWLVAYIVLGVCGVMECYVETRKLIRRGATTKAMPDCLEAPEAS